MLLNDALATVQHYIRADATRTFASVGTAQAIFTNPANGRLTLPVGLYTVDGLLNIGSMSATSGNLAFSLLGAGTATLGSILCHVVGVDGAPGVAATQTGSTMVAAATPVSAVTAGTGTSCTLNIKGSFEVTVAGTLVPSITLVTAAAAVLAVGSYLSIVPRGTVSTVSVGAWS